MRVCAFSSAFLVLAMQPVLANPLLYPSCAKPDRSFQSFLQRFTNEVPFQRSRLGLPLVVRAGDGVTVPATIDLWDIKRIQRLKDPLIYSDAQRKKENISQSIDFVRKEPSVAEVWQGEAGGDAIKLQYWFRNRDGCWFLAEFDDWSE